MDTWPTLDEIKKVMEIISLLVVIISLPIALRQYFHLKSDEAYHAVDEKYLEFLKLCFDHPKLDIFDVQDKAPHNLSPLEKKQEQIAFTMLFSIFERALLMYRSGWVLRKIRERQLPGWLAYLDEFCLRENFRASWGVSGKTFDSDFQTEVDDRIKEATVKSPAKKPRTKSVHQTGD